MPFVPFNSGASPQHAGCTSHFRISPIHPQTSCRTLQGRCSTVAGFPQLNKNCPSLVCIHLSHKGTAGALEGHSCPLKLTQGSLRLFWLAEAAQVHSDSSTSQPLRQNSEVEATNTALQAETSFSSALALCFTTLGLPTVQEM